jgi:hypothetical protein
MSLESHTGSRSGHALKWRDHTLVQKVDYHTSLSLARAEREVFVRKQIAGSIVRRCELKTEGKLLGRPKEAKRQQISTCRLHEMHTCGLGMLG